VLEALCFQVSVRECVYAIASRVCILLAQYHGNSGRNFATLVDDVVEATHELVKF